MSFMKSLSRRGVIMGGAATALTSNVHADQYKILAKITISHPVLKQGEMPFKYQFLHPEKAQQHKLLLSSIGGQTLLVMAGED